VRAGFLSRFEGASCPAKLLEEITIIDTPGVLSGEKQRIERNYNVRLDWCFFKTIYVLRCATLCWVFLPLCPAAQHSYGQYSTAS
jgi:hypothetical protein